VWCKRAMWGGTAEINTFKSPLLLISGSRSRSYSLLREKKLTCRPYIGTPGIKLCPFTNLFTISDRNIANSRWNTISIFFCGAAAQRGLWLPHSRGFLITQRRTTVGRTPLDEWSARRRDVLPDNTQHSQQTNFYVPGGIRTHNLSRRAAADLRLRLRGYWDLPCYVYKP